MPLPNVGVRYPQTGRLINQGKRGLVPAKSHTRENDQAIASLLYGWQFVCLARYRRHAAMWVSRPRCLLRESNLVEIESRQVLKASQRSAAFVAPFQRKKRVWYISCQVGKQKIIVTCACSDHTCLGAPRSRPGNSTVGAPPHFFLRVPHCLHSRQAMEAARENMNISNHYKLAPLKE